MNYLKMREAGRSPPSSAEVKNAWSYTSAPPIRLHDVVLSQAQGQLYLFTFACEKLIYTYISSHPVFLRSNLILSKSEVLCDIYLVFLPSVVSMGSAPIL
jgi:hypothetical protein